MTIDIRTYWPIPTHGHAINKVFDGGLRQAIVSDGTSGAWLEEWVNDAWTDTWHYNATARGVLEDYDLGPSGKTKMVSGKEIVWGNQQNVGDVVEGQCEIASKWPLPPQYGWQRVEFKALLPRYNIPAGTFMSVLQIEYFQYWTSMGVSGGKTSKGAMIWLDTSLGFLKQEWTQNGALTGYGATLQSYKVT